MARISDSAEFHRGNAADSHIARQASTSSEARTAYATAAGLHETSVRLIERRPRLLERATRFRNAVSAQRALPRNRQDLRIINEFERLAAEAELAAEYSLERAQVFFERGMAQRVAARAHEEAAQQQASEPVQEEASKEEVTDEPTPAPARSSRRTAQE